MAARSIGSRMDYLIGLSDDPAKTWRFDTFVRRIYLALLVFLAITARPLRICCGNKGEFHYLQFPISNPASSLQSRVISPNPVIYALANRYDAAQSYVVQSTAGTDSQRSGFSNLAPGFTPVSGSPDTGVAKRLSDRLAAPKIACHNVHL